VIASTLKNILARVQMLRVQMLRGESFVTPSRRADALFELQAVVTAIEQGDGEAAAELATQHVRNAGSAALAMLLEEARKGDDRPGAA
jgi:DNA-binding GntR family transcriptional regulator